MVQALAGGCLTVLLLMLKREAYGLLLGFGLTGGYIAALYILPHQLSRDERRTVQKRMACTLGYCCLAWLPVYYYLDAKDMRQFRQLVGLQQEGALQAMFFPLLTTALLFLGPLVLKATDNDDAFGRRYPSPAYFDPKAWRDLCVAPLTEEFIFRALILRILSFIGMKPASAVLVAPLYFGVAHVHHFREYIVHKGLPVGQALQLVAFQFGYTTVFGWLAAWYFVRYRHLLAAVLPHVFCNYMGMPDLSSISSHSHPCLILSCFLSGIVLFFVAVIWQA